MKILILLFFLFSLIISKDKKEVPKLDLRDAGELEIGIDLGDLFENIEGNPINYLIPEQIEEIKKNAKNYNVKSVKKTDLVILETNLGVLKLKLFPEVAPNHCLNFKKLANSGFYDGTKFHRVIPNFMIQGGDILSRDGRRDNDGTGNPGWTVDAEFNDTKHERGILSMARSPKGPNTAGSQFFICVSNQAHLDGKYTAFGQINDRIHIIDHIVNTPTDSKQAMDLSSSFIPDGENKDDWIQLKNPKTRKIIFFKVPTNREKNEYKSEMMSKLRSDNPVIPIIIKKLRVTNKAEL